MYNLGSCKKILSNHVWAGGCTRGFESWFASDPIAVIDDARSSFWGIDTFASWKKQKYALRNFVMHPDNDGLDFGHGVCCTAKCLDAFHPFEIFLDVKWVRVCDEFDDKCRAHRFAKGLQLATLGNPWFLHFPTQQQVPIKASFSPLILCILGVWMFFYQRFQHKTSTFLSPKSRCFLLRGSGYLVTGYM